MTDNSTFKQPFKLSSILAAMPDIRRSESFSFIAKLYATDTELIQLKVTAKQFELLTWVCDPVIDNRHANFQSLKPLQINTTYFVVCIGNRKTIGRHLVALPITSMGMLTDLTIPKNREDQENLVKHIATLWRNAVGLDANRIHDSIWSFERLKNEL